MNIFKSIFSLCSAFFFSVQPFLHAADGQEQGRRIFELADGKTARLEKLLMQMDKETAAREINTFNKNGSLPLLRAIERGRADNVAILLHYGADPDLTGYLPSREASKNFGVERRYSNTVIPVSGGRGAAVIVQSGRDLFLQVRFSPVSFLSRPRMKDMDNGVELKILEQLLLHGANPNTPDPISGRSPLMNYIERGFEDAIRLLLKQKNIDLNFQTPDGKVSVLSLAKSHKNEPTGKLVLRAIRKKSSAEP